VATGSFKQLPWATGQENRLNTYRGGVPYGVALNQKTGDSAPPLFGLRRFPVELAGLHGVFVARL
jgi:hypothetical protein